MSTTYTAAIVAFLTLVLPIFGVHVVDPNSFAASLSQIIGSLAVLYVPVGRYRAGGLNAFGIRKD